MPRCWNSHCMYWWWRLYRHEIQGLCGRFQQRQGWDSHTAPTNWPCKWFRTGLQFSTWPNLQSSGSQVKHPQGVHQSKPSQQIHSAIIIACSSTNPVGNEDGRWTEVVCGIPSSPSCYGKEPIQSPTCLRNAQQAARSRHLHKTGPAECLSPHLDQARQQVHHRAADQVRAVWVLHHTVLVDECASSVWSAYQQLHMVLRWRPCCVLSGWYTDWLNQCGGAQTVGTISAGTSRRISSEWQRWHVRFWSLRSQLSRICH